MFEPAVVSREAIDKWWARLRAAGGWWRQITGRSYEHFAEALANAALVVELECGLIYFNFDSGRVYVHPMLWARPSDAELGVLDWARERLRLEKLSVAFPASVSVARLAKRCGFKLTRELAEMPFYEGRVWCSIWERS